MNVHHERRCVAIASKPEHGRRALGRYKIVLGVHASLAYPYDHFDHTHGRGTLENMLPKAKHYVARGQHHGARGRHNVARGRHIFQWPEAMGVILTLSYRQGVILAVLKSNMQRCDIDSTEIQYSP